MIRYIVVRIIYSLFILMGTMIIAFVMVRMLPGDPIRAAMQQNVDLKDDTIVLEIRAKYGLDKPIPVQFAMWLGDFVKGEWGVSLSSGQKVWDMFFRRLPITLELFLLSTFWAWALGFPLGIFSAFNRNTWMDVSITGISILQLSIPVFWEAILLIYFLAIIFPIFPPSGYVPFFEDPLSNLLHVAMPTFVMGTAAAGGLARYVRSSLLEVLGQDYIRTARAKGFREKAVILRHAAKPSLIPIVTIIGLSWGGLMGGSFIIELMFAIPGVGRMGLDAVFARDFPVLQAVMVIVSANVLLANLLVDILYGYLDPRVRVQS
jgi:peptide/nickel transport system permease protein